MPSGVSRRAFLRALVAAPALGASVLAVDWEKLLWTPKPIVVVPALPDSWLKDVNLTFLLDVNWTFLLANGIPGGIGVWGGSGS